MVHRLVRRQVEILAVSNKIHSDVEGKLKTSQREYYLRQQLKAIQKELGDGEGGEGADDEVGELERKLADAAPPPAARKAAEKELRRLKRMQPQQPEYVEEEREI